MKRLIFCILTTASIATFLGCGGGKEMAKLSNTPEWFNNVPTDPNSLFGAATASSVDLQTAIDKAKQDARADLAAQTEARVQGLIRNFREETGLAESFEMLAEFSSATQTVFSNVLVGSKVKNQKTMREGTTYRAFLLMELPIGEANVQLLSKIKSNQAMYTRFRSTEAFKKMEDEIAKYEAFKKQQEMGGEKQQQ